MKNITFSTEMVQAILAGRKTMTRRPVKHYCKIEEVREVIRSEHNENDWGKYILTDENGEDFLIKSKFQPGDIVYVKETFAKTGDNWHDDWPGHLKYYYKADDPWNEKEWKEKYPHVKRWYTWRPSRFMPREAARIFLKIADVRCERLHDITDTDAKREGVELLLPSHLYKNYRKGTDPKDGFSYPSSSFETLWRDIYGNESWDSDLWVWVYGFESVEHKF